MNSLAGRGVSRQDAGTISVWGDAAGEEGCCAFAVKAANAVIRISSNANIARSSFQDNNFRARVSGKTGYASLTLKKTDHSNKVLTRSGDEATRSVFSQVRTGFQMPR